uniref:Uncharacterized protein n=1 Tax=Arundo donax TaxID=35708 RepID=A0A0A8YM94_ARUDO
MVKHLFSSVVSRAAQEGGGGLGREGADVDLSERGRRWWGFGRKRCRWLWIWEGEGQAGVQIGRRRPADS